MYGIVWFAFGSLFASAGFLIAASLAAAKRADEIEEWKKFRETLEKGRRL